MNESLNQPTLPRKLERILVPTDFSETASHALRYASEMARALDASLTVLYADPFLPPIDYTATVGAWDDTTFQLVKARAEEQLQRDAEMNIDPAVPFDAIVRVASPVEGILAQARESGAGLIIMGTHGRTGFRRLIIGSVSEEVMRRSEVPVIAVPPHTVTAPPIRTIVCPVVYNAQCFDALTFAAQIAPPDARFIVIDAMLGDEAFDVDQALTELRTWVPDSIVGRCEIRKLEDVHLAGQTGGIARSAHADLIVATEPSDRTATDVLFGTFAERLLQRSDCPVLSVSGAAVLANSRVEEQERRTDVVWANQ